MTPYSGAASSELDDASWRLLADAVERFEDSWHSSAAPRIAKIVPPEGHSLRQRVLVELIKVDQEYRLELGQRKTLKAYLDDWPELQGNTAVVTELARAEVLTRAVVEALPTPEELQEQFPGIWRDIDLQAIAAEAQRDRLRSDGSTQSAAKSDRSTRDSAPFSQGSGAQRLLIAGQAFGRYEIRELLGEGAMGRVHRAYDPHLDREVALKIPQLDEPEVVARFVREARAAAKIRHSNICPIYDVGQVDGVYYITMALIEGHSLAQRMDGQPLQPTDAARLVQKLASALDAVHTQGVIHRDIKPSNVMIDRSGDPLLTDFGLARQVTVSAQVPDAQSLSDSKPTRASELTATGSLLGTPAYMSPEQAAGASLDARSDIYSLGVLFFQMLTGKLPFSGPPERLMEDIIHAEPPKPRDLQDDVPEPLQAICLRAIAKEPADRFPSAKSLREAIDQYLERLPQTSGAASRRRWFVRLCAGVALPCLIAAAVIIYMKTGSGILQLVIKDKDAKVTIDGEQVEVESSGGVIRVALGDHELEARRPGALPHRQSFTIKWRGTRLDLTVPTLPGPQPIHAATLLRRIPTNYFPGAFCVSPDDQMLYVGSAPDGKPAPIDIFRIATGKLDQSIPFPNAAESAKRYDHKGMAISADGRYLFVTHYDQAYISRIDLRHSNARKDLDINCAWPVQAGVTPDNRSLVILSGRDGRVRDENNDRMTIVDIADGRFSLAGHVPLSDEPTGRHVVFSGDSKYAYFVTRRRKSTAPGLCEVRMTPPYEVARTLPFDGGDLRDLAVSNRRKRIYVTDKAGRKISVVDMATLQVVSEMTLDGRVPHSLAVNPQESLLAAACPSTRDLFLLDPEDGTVLAWLKGLPKRVYDIGFSNRFGLLLVSVIEPHRGIGVIRLSRAIMATSIVFASNRAGESYQIYMMGVDGGHVVRLTDNHATDRAPRWSPDGRRIAFVSDREGLPRICVVDTRKRAVRVLHGTDPAMPPPGRVPIDWSPDGSRIVFINRQLTAIRVVDVDTEAIRTLIDKPVVSVDGGETLRNLVYQCVAWTIDGMILLSSQDPTSDRRQDIFQLDPEILTVRRVTNAWGENRFFYAPAPSPDGTRIAALEDAGVLPSQRRIVLMNNQGGEQVHLANGNDGDYAAPAWFPSGKRIVYSARAEAFHHLYSVDVHGGEPNQLSKGEWDDIEPDISGRLRPLPDNPQ